MTERPVILVVDDERNIRLTLRATLEGLGADVLEAADGDAALALTAKQRCDVVLLDLRMPGLDGLEVLRRLRASVPSARVVVITAHGTVDAAVDAMKLGAADFLQKPFEPSQVRAVVTSLLRAGDARTAPARPQVPAPAEGGSPAGLLAAARAAVRAGKIGEAERLARLAAAAAPGDAEPLLVLGAVHQLRGDDLRAQAFHRAAIALRPSFEHAHRNLESLVDPDGGGPPLLGDETLPTRSRR